jgi:hypothetical protein
MPNAPCSCSSVSGEAFCSLAATCAFWPFSAGVLVALFDALSPCSVPFSFGAVDCSGFAAAATFELCSGWSFPLGAWFGSPSRSSFWATF